MYKHTLLVPCIMVLFMAQLKAMNQDQDPMNFTYTLDEKAEELEEYTDHANLEKSILKQDNTTLKEAVQKGKQEVLDSLRPSVIKLLDHYLNQLTTADEALSKKDDSLSKTQLATYIANNKNKIHYNKQQLIDEKKPYNQKKLDLFLKDILDFTTIVIAVQQESPDSVLNRINIDYLQQDKK